MSLVIVALLLFVNGFFVALEFALVALRKTKVDEMVRQGLRGALAVQAGKEHIDDWVAASQLGITIASLALGMVAEDTVIAIIGPPAKEYLNLVITHESGVGFFLAISLVTVLHVVVGEQVPKMMAIKRPGRVALLAAPVAQKLVSLSYFLIVLLNWMTEVVLKLFGMGGASDGGHGHGGQVYSEEEIQALLVKRQQAGLAEEEENEVILRVFSLFDMVATQIMIPRTEMVCVPATATMRDVMELAATAGHDRYPVYGENIDEIVGLIIMKDLVGYIGQNPEGLDAPVSEIWREELSVPGSLSCSSLLQQMREHHTRLAVVIDEYGGTAGMVTLGDVLGRLVGDVDEEDEKEADDISELPDGRFRVSGLVLTEDVESKFETSIDDEHNDTIGGVVFSRLGRMPKIGDRVEFNGLGFTVTELDGARIDRLTVEVLLDLNGAEDFDGSET